MSRSSHQGVNVKADDGSSNLISDCKPTPSPFYGETVEMLKKHYNENFSLEMYSKSSHDYFYPENCGDRSRL